MAFTLRQFEDFVASMSFLGETGWTVKALDENTEEVTQNGRYLNSFLHDLFDRFRDYPLWDDRTGTSRREVEEEVAYFLARALKRPLLIPKPDHADFGTKFFYAFRGTTKGFPGSTGFCYCSLSPVVSTSFAMKTPGPLGGKVLQIATYSDLSNKGVGANEGNVMAGYEREIIITTTPDKFAEYAFKTITMENAAEILREMGIPLPSGTGAIDTRVHDEILLSHGRMDIVKINRFIDEAKGKPDAS